MDRLRSAWKTMTEGTTRTLKWMAGGMRRSKDGDAKPEPAPAANAERTWGERLEERTGHSQRAIGLAAGLAVIVALWIGWTAYVWSENGSTAAIGVLISWPAALAAVTLVTAPFIGGAVAVRRHRAGEPVLAGAFTSSEATTAEAEEPAEDEEPDDAAPEGESEPESESDEEDDAEDSEDEASADEDSDDESEDDDSDDKAPESAPSA